MSDHDQNLIEEAEKYIKEHKRELIDRFADAKIYLPDEHPRTFFMAGSPGAGKTEISRRLIEGFTGKLPVRIDADDIRTMFPSYTGTNSHIFQRACTVGVNKLFDYILDKNLNAILDGTFAYERAMENIKRSLDHNRTVIIYYLFQEPADAWFFTTIREKKEGRRVAKEVFISSFIKARENVKAAKAMFGPKIELNLIIRNFKTDFDQAFHNIDDVDKNLPKVYTRDELEKLL